MSDYVLDTHALVFALASPRRLGRAARSVLRRVERGMDRAWLPAVAIAEVCMLRELGRVRIGLPEIRTLVVDLPQMSLLPLDLAQLDAFAALSAIRDPFDRLIIAAARATSSRLLTRDTAIAESGLAQVVWD